MTGFPSPFSGESDDLFDETGEFNTDHIPSPGWFLEGHDILTGNTHLAFHETTEEVFEARSVYDMTFGYNLARLNLDTRHPDAGYRYAEEAGDPSVLRAEFTPTTPFCPQSDTLTKGSFRAWNDLSDQHDYDLVRVRVAEMHNQSEQINRTLKQLEESYLDTGSVRDPQNQDDTTGGASGCGDKAGTTSRGYGPDAPF